MTDDHLPEPPLSKPETRRRLPSLSLIEDPEIRSETLRISRFAPDYFWQRPGSNAGYHHPDPHGLWGHTLCLSTIIDRLEDSLDGRNELRERDISRAHAVAILHDQRKGEQTHDDHDLRMAEVIRDKSYLDERVAAAVDSHMGPWGVGPDPVSRLSRLVHSADMIASATESGIDIDVPAPIPEELAEAGYSEVNL
jgi:hypothetical protein